MIMFPETPRAKMPTCHKPLYNETRWNFLHLVKKTPTPPWEIPEVQNCYSTGGKSDRRYTLQRHADKWRPFPSRIITSLRKGFDLQLCFTEY